MGFHTMHKYINWYIILHLQMSTLSLFIYSIISRQNVQYKLKKLSFISVKALLLLFLLHIIFCDFQVRVFGIFIRVVKISWFTFFLFFSLVYIYIYIYIYTFFFFLIKVVLWPLWIKRGVAPDTKWFHFQEIWCMWEGVIRYW